MRWALSSAFVLLATAAARGAEQQRTWRLRARPGDDEKLSVHDHFELVNDAEGEAPPLSAGEVRVRPVAFSVDPYMRGRFRAPSLAMRDYVMPPFDVGAPIVGGGVAVVTASRADGVAVGDRVTALLPWQTRATVRADAPFFGKLDAAVSDEHALSVLGLTGASCELPVYHFWLKQRGGADAVRGKTAFVSGAAGAVGSVCVQYLLALGVDVIGSAGSDEKVALLESWGARAFNYKHAAWREQLAAHVDAVGGRLDVYFDNVGGAMLDEALLHMARHGLVIACGAIATYEAANDARHHVKRWFLVIVKSLTVKGFLVSDWPPAEWAASFARLAPLLADGRVRTLSTPTYGFANLPTALVGLFAGANTGKAVVVVDADEYRPARAHHTEL